MEVQDIFPPAAVWTCRMTVSFPPSAVWTCWLQGVSPPQQYICTCRLQGVSATSSMDTPDVFLLQAVRAMGMQGVRLSTSFQSALYRNDKERRCWNQSGTRIRGPSPVPEFSCKGLRCRMPMLMPAASTLMPMPSYMVNGPSDNE
jgi:hypothetical protein